MKTYDMTCIMCPMGCSLKATVKDKDITVTGNNCIRGEHFAKEELTCPKRVVTSSVKTNNGVKSCKTNKPVPKDKIFKVMKEIEKLRLENTKYGQIVIKNVLNTGADIVITAD